MVSFVIARRHRLPVAVGGLSIGGLVAGILILPLPIVLGYGVRAAEREDRRRRFH